MYNSREQSFMIYDTCISIVTGFLFIFSDREIIIILERSILGWVNLQEALL